MRPSLALCEAAASSNIGASGTERPAPDAGGTDTSRSAAPKAADPLRRDSAAKSRAPPKPSASGDLPGGAPHKPYTVPPGWKAPTLGEQFRYAALRHPYYRYGYVAAVAMGLLGWAVASGEKKAERQLEGGGAADRSSGTK